MQSNKASKKTRKNAEETAAAGPEIGAAAEKTAKPRASRSSKSKKPEVSDAVSANHHHKVSSPVAAEVASVETSPVARTFAAAAAASSASPEAAIVDPAGVVAPAVEISQSKTPVTETAPRSATREEIAKLAHSYWVARGYAHGFAEEDWLRAERELNGKL
jgi:hypothetical protein